MMRCLLLLSLAACDVYPSWKGEFNAGPVDPFNYPPDYLGAGGDRQRVATGSFTAISAYAQGEKVGYYRFNFSPSSSGTSAKPADPLAITIEDATQETLPTPPAYMFFNKNRCYTDGSYSYDPRTSDVHYDEQSNVITALPTAVYNTAGKTATWTYQPVVKEIAVNANELQCQTIKSEATLKDIMGDVQPSGRYFAWALIDPGAAVYRVGESINNATGVGPQSFGWYNKYLAAYIDGGEIPTIDDLTKDGKPTKRMATQRLFFPKTAVIAPPKAGAMGATGGSGTPGAIGQGYDVLEAPRADESLYSPVCAVFTYDLPAPTAIADLPKDSETIISNYSASFKAGSPPYIFCLQVQQ